MAAMDTISGLRAQLNARKGEWPALCIEAGLSYWWLIKFAQGRIREPGLLKIERLQDVLGAEPTGEEPDSAVSANADVGRIVPIEGA